VANFWNPTGRQIPLLRDQDVDGLAVLVDRSIRGCCICGGRGRAGCADAPSPLSSPSPQSGFAGFRFPPDVIMATVRWYLRYELSYRDVEELLTERGITIVT
jgi:hypothetical protein